MRRSRRRTPRRCPAAGAREDAASRPRWARGRFTEIDLGYSAEQAVSEAKRCLACGLCSECMQCVKVCTAGAVCHDQQPEEIEIDAGSVILTPGFEEFQGSLRGEFGHGRYANVLSSVQFERMLSRRVPPADMSSGLRTPARWNASRSSNASAAATPPEATDIARPSAA